MRFHRLIMASTFLAGTFVAGAAITSNANATVVNLIQDGSFESPTISSWYEEYGATPPAGTNYGGTSFSSSWTVTTNNVDIVSGAITGSQAYSGSQYLDLVGTGTTGGISQTFATTVGTTYTLTFAYANNPWSTTTASASVSVVGSNGPEFYDTVTHDTSTTADGLFWTLFTATFVADSTTSTLSFTNLVGAENGGVLLDDVSVVDPPSAVPEPATWVMMLAGFAGVGYLGYRRKKNGGASMAAAA